MMSVDVKEIRAAGTDTMQAFGPFYREAMTKAIEATGLGPKWFPLHLAAGIAPEPFSTQRYHALYPYHKFAARVATLDELAETEYLQKIGADTYRITEQGKALVQGIFRAAHTSLGENEFLPDGEMAEIAALLKKLVAAVEASEQPPTKWALEHSRAVDPGAGSAYAAQIDQYLTDLYSVRDDAHIAAWKGYGLAPHVWEALTFLWNGEGNSAAMLAEKLAFRDHSEQDYAAALEELAAQGLAEKAAEGYRITEQGHVMRENAEQETDRIYFSAWDALSAAEQTQLYTLLTRLKAKLVELAAEKEALVA